MGTNQNILWKAYYYKSSKEERPSWILVILYVATNRKVVPHYIIYFYAAGCALWKLKIDWKSFVIVFINLKIIDIMIMLNQVQM